MTSVIKKYDTEEPSSLLTEVRSISARCFDAFLARYEITPENAVAYREIYKLIDPQRKMLVNILPPATAEFDFWRVPKIGTEPFNTFRNRQDARVAKSRGKELKLQHVYDEISDRVPPSHASDEAKQAWIQPALDIVNEQVCRVPDDDKCSNIAVQCLVAAVKLAAYVVRLEPNALHTEWVLFNAYLHQIEMMLSLALIAMKNMESVFGTGEKYVATIHVFMTMFRTILQSHELRLFRLEQPLSDDFWNATHTFSHGYEFLLRLQKYTYVTA